MPCDNHAKHRGSRSQALLAYVAARSPSPSATRSCLPAVVAGALALQQLLTSSTYQHTLEIDLERSPGTAAAARALAALVPGAEPEKLALDSKFILTL